tara:strand:- start:141 stop:389 length:249 start_codon:yes stop_codon:yes gene_type:complete
MSRKIIIAKYEGNTHYSVDVIDSYGTEHHVGYYSHYSQMHDIEDLAKGIWDNEVEPEEDLMSKAVLECINLDRIRGVEPNLD